MTVALKAGAGLLAGIVAGGLGYCFWPHVEPGMLAPRSAVVKPVFVVATAATRSVNFAPVAPPLAAPAAPVGDKASLEKLAAALKGDPKPIAPLVPSAPKSPAPSEEAARFSAHGLVALAEGDVASARRFLQRAAEAGDARALMALGDTYDAVALARLGVVGIHGDAARAREFFAKALAAGVGAAKERMAALEASRD